MVSADVILVRERSEEAKHWRSSMSALFVCIRISRPVTRCSSTCSTSSTTPRQGVKGCLTLPQLCRPSLLARIDWGSVWSTSEPVASWCYRGLWKCSTSRRARSRTLAGYVLFMSRSSFSKSWLGGSRTALRLSKHTHTHGHKSILESALTGIVCSLGIQAFQRGHKAIRVMSFLFQYAQK
jgi:hypothetical protein